MINRTDLERERECSVEEAEKRFSREIKALNLKCELSTFGQQPIETTRCDLLCSKSSKRVGQGFGKGIDKRSELSAKYESLEYYTGLLTNCNQDHLLLSLNEALSSKTSIIESRIPTDFLERGAEVQNRKIPWVSYSRYGVNSEALVPAFCTHPHYLYHPFENDEFDYSPFYLPLVSHGLATGCTKTEALIHAILELVETDSLSLFMIQTFLRRRISLINPVCHFHCSH